MRAATGVARLRQSGQICGIGGRLTGVVPGAVDELPG